MKRYIVRSEDQSWLVIDTLTTKVIKQYSFESKATEVAECKNWDEEQEIFAEFG